jgi:hypothetical protein
MFLMRLGPVGSGSHKRCYPLSPRAPLTPFKSSMSRALAHRPSQAFPQTKVRFATDGEITIALPLVNLAGYVLPTCRRNSGQSAGEARPQPWPVVIFNGQDAFWILGCSFRHRSFGDRSDVERVLSTK